MASILVNSIVVYRGASKTFELTVTDSAGVAVDLTGSRILFTVKCSVDEPYPLIQKDSAKGATEVEFHAPREGKVKIYLDPADTQNKDVGKYTFDVWAVLANSKRYPVVEPSVFEIKAGVTLIS